MSSGILHNRAVYANGIDFWRRQKNKTWQDLADAADVSLPVLRRSAQTLYDVFVKTNTDVTIAVPSGCRTGRRSGGVLSTEKLQAVAAALDTTLIDLLRTPSDLEKLSIELPK